MKDTLIRHQQAWRTLAALLSALPLLVWAGSSATVTVKVTVVAPPACRVNENGPIEVEFGDVMTTQVDGNHYKRPVIYTLSCPDASSNAIKLQVKGTGAEFDTTVLQSNKAGLGIELRQGSSKLAINDWLKFTYPNKPELWAVPVKERGATLTGGEFSAGATMEVAYQ